MRLCRLDATINPPLVIELFEHPLKSCKIEVCSHPNHSFYFTSNSERGQGNSCENNKKT